MDLRLTFSDGRITGDGADAVGLFIIAGGYDDADGQCDWTKTYVGAHDVRYAGCREGKGIWGTWQLDGGWTGGFEIWPLDGDVVALTADEEAEETKPLEIGAPAQPVTIRSSRGEPHLASSSSRIHAASASRRCAAASSGVPGALTSPRWSASSQPASAR